MDVERIVEARMRLRDRFLARMEATPGVADPKPLGQGPPNRHGMPQVPIGQHVVDKWPVLDLGTHPAMTLQEWRLRLDGSCDHPVTLTWLDFLNLPQTEDVSDFHCVTTWSKLDMPWVGVRLADLAALAQVRDTASHVLCHASDGYSTNLSLEEGLKPDVLLVHTWQGRPLPREHGGPVRVITPQLYAWKGAKWICRLEFLDHDVQGFWERNGYSNTAHPWRDDRYS